MSEVVAAKSFVDFHALFDCFKHLNVFVELVICKVDLLKLFCCGNALKNNLGAFIAEVVSGKDDLLELAL